ncbi:arylsulfatase B [Roseimaritima sediminicola]|uniref:arylsulfatase B n=1 Tax=Roseimaritima sediminicola TaxID=2662066 RepID=UPI0012984D7B|nr:arylsulfatase [Roseimaritima sediminicola]
MQCWSALMRLWKKTVLVALVASAGTSIGAPPVAAEPVAALAPHRPNIVFMLSDDMGWAEPGFHGGNAELTPHLDRLAAEGVRLRQFYTHSVCAPTRGALLSGRYAFRNWMDWRSEDFGKPSYLAKLNLQLAHNERGEPTRRIHALPSEERTVAEVLADAGYFTAITGKWHCGEWLEEHLPMGQGFQHQYGHYAWGIDYNQYTIPHNAPARFAVYDWHRNQRPLFEQGYTTDLIAGEVVRLLGERSEGGEDAAAEQPFFIYVPFNAVHGPIEEVPRYTDQYPAREAALKCLDDAVGRIVGAVDQLGYRDNTLVIFANDNGGLTEAMNAPYRGTKNTTFEGGVRVPCVMRYPGRIEAGTTNDGMMHVVDLLPTFAALAGASLEGTLPLDGMDMTPTLFAGRPSPRQEIIFEVAGSVRLPTIRSGDYKLMGDMLFDIRRDPYETTDIAAQHPDIVQRLAAKLEAAAEQRPPMGEKTRLMDPPLPYVYGQKENVDPPAWLVDLVDAVRAEQPQSWAEGETPWPQAPQGATIEYTGDGR